MLARSRGWYEYVTCRSTAPDTVATVVLQEAVHRRAARLLATRRAVVVTPEVLPVEVLPVVLLISQLPRCSFWKSTLPLRPSTGITQTLPHSSARRVLSACFSLTWTVFGSIAVNFSVRTHGSRTGAGGPSHRS